MIPSEDKRVSLDAQKFSFASDIVELVVLTGDDTFLQTLREGVGSSRRLWHVPSADKVSDLLVAGEVGILVLDLQALQDTAHVFIAQIKRQFPDLVVVVAGTRGSEIAIAALISAGTVYRFIHKPMSPARAKLFAEAAVKKYDEKRRRTPLTSVIKRRARVHPGWLIGGTTAFLAVIAAVTWMVHSRSRAAANAQHISTMRAATVESPALAAADAALAANRLAQPPGDNALELYTQALARNPADAKARAGLAEVRERLLARAENALLEERLDEAEAAIDIARKSGVEPGRVAFLTAQLTKSREQMKTAQAQVRAQPSAKTAEDRVTPLLNLAEARMNEGRLVDPERDSARRYILEALRADPANGAALALQRTLAARLLGEIQAAIDRRDFTRAAARLETARGLASKANIDAAESSLAGARKQANADAVAQLLKNATERLQQDRLIEPANDNAKYYLMTLRGLDPNNAGLGAAMQDLGVRLIAKGRRALSLEQFDAARSWLDESAGIGYTSPESGLLQQDLEAAAARQKFYTNVMAANELTQVKTVNPVYPRKAEFHKTEGWVELDFTVADSGAVRDIAIHAASNPGVFEDAAKAALAQWRYKPVLKEGRPVSQRARIRIRFSLAA